MMDAQDVPEFDTAWLRELVMRNIVRPAADTGYSDARSTK